MGTSPTVAPIFIFAESDRAATQRIFEHIHDEFFYIPVHDPHLVVQYARQFATTAIFLAAPIDYPRGGAAALLQRLIDDVRKPVIILIEDWSSEEADRWKKLGASDCIPHPTRLRIRLEVLRRKMQLLAVPGPEIRGQEEGPS